MAHHMIFFLSDSVVWEIFDHCDITYTEHAYIHKVQLLIVWCFKNLSHVTSNWLSLTRPVILSRPIIYWLADFLI